MSKNFLDITDADLTSLIQANDLVLVDFWAVWCGPCVRFGPVIESLADLYKERVVVCKLNIDEHSSATTYKVKTIPTVIIFYKGIEVKRLIGSVPLETLQEILDSYLP
ncbi:MAG: thiol reductase thioredoxin [Amoebophilaceae bacterium]|nr:thiol reductase thioredoxin [Amoebophilaceae bacterium]